MFLSLGGWPWLRATVALLIACGLLTRRAPRLSGWLWALLLASVGRDVLKVVFLFPCRLAHTTIPPLVLSADTALWLVGPASLVGLVWGCFGGMGRWVWACWVGASIALSITCPTGVALAQAYLAVQLAAVLVSAYAVVRWLWRRERPTTAHAIGLLSVAVSGAILLSSAWRLGDPFLRWRVAQEMIMCEFVIMSLLTTRLQRS